ncbi:NUDIX hydrolase domain-like protein [Geopyxis carbonaria]|nr:NUDIX hydrolase domain-like protein [Geopyxis carbonaria]
MPPPYSNLDLVAQLDTFPSAATHPTHHAERLSTLHLFTSGSHILGHLTPAVVAALSNPTLSGTWWTITPSTVTLAGATAAERSAHIAATAAAWRAADTFTILRGWRSELYSVFCPANALYLRVERAAAALFGVVMYGVHLTAYVPPAPAAPLRIWVPRRAAAKATYPRMLDNTVAGGIESGTGVLETVVKECGEEASLPEALVRERVRAAGAVSYIHERGPRAGGETGLVQPEVQYVFDLPLEEGTVCVPCDGEVEAFQLWTVEECQAALAAGEFKPNCAVVMIDFFVRHGILTPENEPEYLHIAARIHRALEFPLAGLGGHEQ